MRMKMNDRFEDERGEVVELTLDGGRLPEGLSEGFQVRVVRRLGGDRRLVEREGREWVVGAGQIRLRRRLSPVTPIGGEETWNLPLRAVRPRMPDRSGILASSPGFRRPGH